MAKLTGPLFSTEAHKALAKTLTYQRRPGGAAVYPYKKPKVPLTDRQLWQREKIYWCVYAWQQLSDEQKAEWEAKAKGQRQSGYSYFIKQKKGFILDPSLALYLPLYDTELMGSSFTSRETYEHLCAVTGAVWTPQGRDFDQLDNLLDLGDIDAVDFGAGDFCLIAWVKRDAIDISHMIFGKEGGGSYEQFVMRISSTNGIRIRYWTAPGAGVQLDTAAAITDTTEFHCVGAQRNGDSFDVFKDGELFESGTTGGTHGTMQTPVSKLYIGARQRSGAENYFGGIIGEVLALGRSFTAPEHLHYYMATKWRYC